MQLKLYFIYNLIYVLLNTYIKTCFTVCFTVCISCQCESIFTVREYFYSAGVQAILREWVFFAGVRSLPAIQIFSPTPDRSRGVPKGPTGLSQCETPFWGSKCKAIWSTLVSINSKEVSISLMITVLVIRKRL